MTLAGTFGGLACGYNSGVVAPVMLYMDQIYPGITAISKAVSFACKFMPAGICKLCHLDWHVGGYDGGSLRRQVRKALEHNFLRLLLDRRCGSPKYLLGLSYALTRTADCRVRPRPLDDVGPDFLGRVRALGSEAADRAVVLLHVLHRADP